MSTRSSDARGLYLGALGGNRISMEYAMLLRTTNNLVRGNNYLFNVQFRTGSQLSKKEDFWAIEAKINIDDHYLLFVPLQRELTTKFLNSTEITFWYQEKMFETLWVNNQGNAWIAMTACQQAHST